ncbi:MAG: NUDIX hydrolase [Anaerolineae bacterium]
MFSETIIESQTIYTGRVFDVELDTVRLPDGRTGTREIIRHGGAAAIVPIDDEGCVIMVRQFRLPANRELLEIPAGGLDSPDEPPRDCAIRELQEETGYRPGELVALGGFFVAPGYTTEYIHLFLGRHLTPSRLEMDSDEYIAVTRVPFDEALAMAYDGRLIDSKSIIALVRAARYLQG